MSSASCQAFIRTYVKNETVWINLYTYKSQLNLYSLQCIDMRYIGLALIFKLFKIKGHYIILYYYKKKKKKFYLHA